jgi:multidrug efflux pump subunit AcrB
MALSALVALTLTPRCARPCSSRLRRRNRRAASSTFNRGVERSQLAYQGRLGVVTQPRRWMAFYLLLVVMVALYAQMPTGFLPVEDQGQVTPVLHAGRYADGAYRSVGRADQPLLHGAREARTWMWCSWWSAATMPAPARTPGRAFSP